MKSRLRSLVALVVIAGAGASSSCSREASDGGHRIISLESCVSDLTNLAHFAETPVGIPHMESSYDRAGGNADWGKFSKPDQDGLYTLVDLRGPGCLKRFWQTNLGIDEYFFFVDGEKEARIRAKRFDLFGGKPFGFPLTGMSGGAGEFLYVPVPFEKSLRIAGSVLKGQISDRPYFQVNYDTYDKTVRVVSFPKAMDGPQKELLAAAGSAWTGKEGAARGAAGACTRVKTVTVMPGQSVAWLDERTAGVLRTFRLSINEEQDRPALAKLRRLREVVLRFHWDGAAEPSVDVPVGDFFCNGLQRRQFSSLPLAVLEDAMVCRFPMPYRTSARAELRNDGEEPVTVTVGWDIQPLNPATDQGLNYFHACWNSSASPGVPHRVLRAQGKGHYVGCYLIALGMDGTWNMLEGDDLAYLNGEPSASLHGTGLEDYFNGAWYYNGLFDLSLHGLVDKAAMRTSQYRFHLPDAIGFRNGFLMNWEFGDDNRNMGRGYMSSVAYWYQPEPHPAGSQFLAAARRFPASDPTELPCAMAGLFELERIMHYDEAADRCRYFAAKCAGTEWAGVFLLRAAAYREVLDGFSAVRQEYEKIARVAPGTSAGRQAGMLAWFHGAPSNAFVAAHAAMDVKLYLDGKEVGKGRDPSSLLVFPATIVPGEHEIAVEVMPFCQGPWASFYIRTHTTNVSSDAAWECSSARPANWPFTDDPAVTWTNVVHSSGDVPKIAWWQFVPNAFVNMQNGGRLIEIAWDGWGAQPFKPTYLRRRFVVPAN